MSLGQLDHLMHIYRVLLSMSAVPRGTIFCSSVVVILLGILLLVFCKFPSCKAQEHHAMIFSAVAVFIFHTFLISYKIFILLQARAFFTVFKEILYSFLYEKT